MRTVIHIFTLFFLFKPRKTPHCFLFTDGDYVNQIILKFNGFKDVMQMFSFCVIVKFSERLKKTNKDDFHFRIHLKIVVILLSGIDSEAEKTTRSSTVKTYL